MTHFVAGPCTIDVGENVVVMNSEDAITTADTVDSGEYVTLSCKEGYTADGTAKVTCNNGEWDGSIESFQCLGKDNGLQRVYRAWRF